MSKQFYIKYSILILILFQCYCSPAQNPHKIDSLLNLIESTQNDTVKISALIRLSKLFNHNNSTKAFEYGLKALTFSIKLNYPKSSGDAHNNLGELYWFKADYGSSYEHYFKALKIFENFNDKASTADCYRNIGWIYDQQNNFYAAFDYHKKSLILNQELHRKKKVGENYNDIGIVYLELKKYSEALENFQNSLKIKEEIGDIENAAVNCRNLSHVYDEKGELTTAIKYAEKAVEIAEKTGNKWLSSEMYIELGVIYIKAERFNESFVYLQRAEEYEKEINDKLAIVNIYDSFSKMYEKQNNYRKANEYAAQASALKDSINNESNIKQANEMTAKYESEKKELEIVSLQKEKVNERNFKIFLIFFCLLAASFAFVLFRGNSQKRKANKALSTAYEEIEEKNKDITDSINYSKRIQEASLAPKELKYKLFPDAFVLFQPKDIVSGDFYWFAEKNGKKLIAACDCTGHGVPGSLMSMIGNNILNQIVNEKGITAPDEILNLLHKEIRKALKQDNQGDTKDGMDIALLTFNNEAEIEYAGAYRPLWIVKAPADFTEIKPDKYSIGGAQSETERKFTNHKISLSKGDAVYIFSDGYADQFGGEEGKKFMSRKFKELLMANYKLPMLQQETVLVSAMETWKGTREQVDDILVIGIRL